MRLDLFRLCCVFQSHATAHLAAAAALAYFAVLSPKTLDSNGECMLQIQEMFELLGSRRLPGRQAQTSKCYVVGCSVAAESSSSSVIRAEIQMLLEGVIQQLSW